MRDGEENYVASRAIVQLERKKTVEIVGEGRAVVVESLVGWLAEEMYKLPVERNEKWLECRRKGPTDQKRGGKDKWR